MPISVSLILCVLLAHPSQARRRSPSSEATVTPAPTATAEVAPATAAPPVAAQAPVAAPAAVAPSAAPVQPAPVATPNLAAPAAPTTPSAPPPPLVAGGPAATNPDPNRLPPVRPSVFVLYNTGTQFYFDSVNATALGQTVSGDARFTFEMAPGLGLELGQSRETGWGWQAGVAYSFGRALKAARVDLGGTSVAATYPGDSTKLTIFDLSASALYRWSSFYLPFGLNYIVPNLSGSSYSINGALGVQFGLGLHAADHVTLELLDKLVAMRATLNTPDVTANFGTGYMNGVQINAKYDF